MTRASIVYLTMRLLSSRHRAPGLLLLLFVAAAWAPDVEAQQAAVEVYIQESLSIEDEVVVAPPASVNVAEALSISDAVTVAPPVSVDVTEALSISDAVTVAPPVTVAVQESLSLDDAETIELNASLPVALVAFEAVLDGHDVHLTWRTAQEAGNAGFAVERARGEAPDGWEALAFVEGAGSSSEPQVYDFRDRAVPPEAGRLRYRLRQVDFDGTVRFSPVVEVAVEVPRQFVLHPAYPNPFNPRTTIRYELPSAQHVRLTVYDALGREVAVLADGPRPAGRHAVVFDAEALPSGLYFYRLQAGPSRAERTVLLMK